MKAGEKFFIVDLESVSFFNPDAVKKIAADEKKYKKTPFLFLIASNSRNEAINWADSNLGYLEKRKKGAWMIYCFEKE